MKDVKRLAICVPTYNSSQIFKEYLSNMIEYLRDLDVDVYVFDSSTNNLTYDIVNGYKQYDNLFYVRISEETHSNMKVYKIFQGYGIKRKYEYMWLNIDYVTWNKSVVEAVLSYTQEGYDLIVVDDNDMYNLGVKKYSDKVLFFKECCWRLITYLGAVVKTSTMLKNVDWNFLTQKYGVEERINFSHVGFYFEKISELDRFSALHYPVDNSLFVSSPLKKNSMWIKSALKLWGDYYFNAIYALPKMYNKYKDYVIKIHNTSMEILGKNNIIIFRKLGLYDYKTYETYKGRWPLITSASDIFLSKVANSIVQEVEIEGEKFLYVEDEDFVGFLKDSTRVYIYGAGKISKIYTQLLCNMNININGYIVSEIRNEDLLGRENLIDIQQFIEQKEHGDRVIIALGKKNKMEVCANLFRLKVDPNDFYCEDLSMVHVPEWMELCKDKELLCE